MSPGEGPPLTQQFLRPLDEVRLVGKLTASATRVGEERPDPTLDVDPAITSRRPGRRGERIEELLARHEMLRQRLEHPCARMEGHPSQRGSTDSARVPEHLPEIEPTAGRLSDHLAGHRVVQGGRTPGASHPLPEGVVLQTVDHRGCVSFQVLRMAACVGRSAGTSRSGSTSRHPACIAAGRR